MNIYFVSFSINKYSIDFFVVVVVGIMLDISIHG